MTEPVQSPGHITETASPWAGVWRGAWHAERGLLAACLFPLPHDDQPALVQYIARALPVEAWSDPRHLTILRALLAATARGVAVPFEHVAEFLPGLGLQDLCDLAHWADSAALIPGRVRCLRRVAVARCARRLLLTAFPPRTWGALLSPHTLARATALLAAEARLWRPRAASCAERLAQDLAAILAEAPRSPTTQLATAEAHLRAWLAG